MENTTNRKWFETRALQSASVPDPEIFYARSADECITLDGSKGYHLFKLSFMVLPHPDVTLKEFLVITQAKQGS